MICTFNDIKKIAAISNNIDGKSIEPYIVEAENFEIRAFLGEKFYDDLIQSFEDNDLTAKEELLIYGGTYTYQSTTYKFDGLIPAIAYFAFARWIGDSTERATRYGMRVKTNEFSTVPSESGIQRRIANARSSALAYQERASVFLSRMSNDYPLWNCGINRVKTNVRIRAIGGNSSDKRKYLDDVCEICNCYNCNCI